MKELKDFPGYFISKDGRVFSAWKQKINGKFTSYLDYNNLKELKPRKDKSGYLDVRIYHNSKSQSKKVHRLVAETYIENPNNLPQVNHIDENKTNNCVLNLEWVSNHQNIVHSRCRWIWGIENLLTGEIVETINMREFSKNNSLDRSSLMRTLTGRQKQHKNYRIISKKQFK